MIVIFDVSEVLRYFVDPPLCSIFNVDEVPDLFLRRVRRADGAPTEMAKWRFCGAKSTKQDTSPMSWNAAVCVVSAT